MHIFIRLPTGRTITMAVSASDTIGKLKTQIECKVGIPCIDQVLVFDNQQLDDWRSITDCNIRNVFTLHLYIVPMSITRARAVAAEHAWRHTNDILARTEDARQKWSDEALRMGWGQFASRRGLAAADTTGSSSRDASDTTSCSRSAATDATGSTSRDASDATTSTELVAVEANELPSATKRQRKRKRQQYAKAR